MKTSSRIRIVLSAEEFAAIISGGCTEPKVYSSIPANVSIEISMARDISWNMLYGIVEKAQREAENRREPTL